MRQMHNYVSLENSTTEWLNTPADDHEYNKIKEGEYSLEALQKKRNEDLLNLGFENKPRM
jgi:hypothetical protein